MEAHVPQEACGGRQYLVGVLPVCSFYCVVMGINLGHQVWWHVLLLIELAHQP